MSSKRGCLLLMGIVSCIVLILGVVELLKSPRDKYRTIDFENDPWMEGFVSDYQQAIIEEEEWVKDAEKVALRVAGYPNIDNIPPEKVDLQTTQGGIVLVKVLSRILMDDSIKREETRVELIKDENIWRIVWAGTRQQCYRGSIGNSWSKSPCP